MRLFVAVELPSAARTSLAATQQVLDARLAQANLASTLRWTAPENIHLTLRFLGESSATQQMQIEAALERIARHHGPNTLEIAGLGAFPSFRKPSVIWTGVRGLPHAVAALSALHAPIEHAAREAAFPAEDRPFSPHLTLARFRREAHAAALGQAGALLRSAAADPALTTWRLPFPIVAVVLMRSDLRSEGATYIPVGRYPLTG
jgi:2'-5' RNA ligase